MTRNLILFTGMTTLFNRLSKISVAVEFNEDTVTFSCFKNRFAGVSLLSSSSFPLRDDEETITVIKSYLSSYSGAGGIGNVYASIPAKWTIIKFVEIPAPKSKGENAISQMMRFEIERHVPYQIDDILYDFQIVEKKESAYTFVFAAIPKDKINFAKNFLEKISLVPDILIPSAFAVLNFVEFCETRVGGWKNFLGIGTKSPVWGNKEDICISLFIKENYVQSALLKNGLCTQLKSFSLDLDKPQDALADDISSELVDVRAGTPLEKINKLTLSGDSAVSLQELSGALSSKLGVKTQIMAPLKSIAEDKDANIQRFAPNIGAFYSGLGIGSMKINLLAHKRTFAETKPGSLITRIFLLLIIILAIVIFAGNLINSKRALSKIDERLKINSPQVEIIRKLSSESAAAGKQRSFLRNVKENHFPLDALAELSVIIPSDAWLTNFNYKETYDKENKTTKRELVISGFANSSSVLISLLEDSPFFEKVEFAGPITKKNEKEGFKIKAAVVKPMKPVENPKTEVKKIRGSNLKITEGQK